MMPFVMTVAGLFAGIGGFERAFAQAGFETRLLAEIDHAARAILEERFPGIQIGEDVARLTELPHGTEIVTVGFPCQNLSMAGDKSGIDGDKSSAVKAIFPLIERANVGTVVIENVYFMLQLKSGDAMRWLVERFEKLEFNWAYRVLDTMGFGLPQRRRRVYMVASREIDPRSVLFADDAHASVAENYDLSRPLGFYWTEGRSGVGFVSDAIPPIKAGSSLGIPSPPAALFPDGEVLIPDIAACERLQGFPEGWTRLAEGRGTRGIRWRLIGNAVSVPVAQWIAERLREPGTPREFEIFELGDGDRWPDSGWNVGDGRIGAIASDKPFDARPPSIATFRDAFWSRLSDRALNGFIGRAVEGGLRMPPGFLEALRSADRRPPSVSRQRARR